ncbi:hypothetical protein HAX54_044860 [Datura stramonium]|uniref:Uncharacterized protein n=1 Tax=Datura stramonium TaxID=4076 RepID=A0ABS8RP58_DATST|nr:hypothetical protein [Datura stramonium]
MHLEDPARGHCYYGKIEELYDLLEICMCSLVITMSGRKASLVIQITWILVDLLTYKLFWKIQHRFGHMGDDSLVGAYAQFIHELWHLASYCCEEDWGIQVEQPS